jgi:hypothetical protein
MRIPVLLFRLGCVATGAALAACGDDTTLPTPIFENVVDTITLHALTGTAIGLPSGYDGVTGTAARTDLSASFDFAVDLPADDVVELLTTGALGLTVDPGIAISLLSFDGLVIAPGEDYVRDSVLTAGEGTVFVLRSRQTTQLCSIGALPRYSKFHILDIDPAARTVTFEFLVNRNCGYRGLQPGTPVE